MNSTTYRNLLKLLERWPIETSKTGRDFGEFIRNSITTSFKSGNPNLKHWDEIIDHLTPLAGDRYTKKFPIDNPSTVFGLSKEANTYAVSNKYFKEVKEDSEKGFYAKYIGPRFTRFTRKPEKEAAQKAQN